MWTFRRGCCTLPEKLSSSRRTNIFCGKLLFVLVLIMFAKKNLRRCDRITNFSRLIVCIKLIIRLCVHSPAWINYLICMGGHRCLIWWTNCDLKRLDYSNIIVNFNSEIFLTTIDIHKFNYLNEDWNYLKMLWDL